MRRAEIILILFILFVGTHSVSTDRQFFHSGETETKYPRDSLRDPTAIHPLSGQPPPVRCHHSVTYVNNFVVVFGGFSTSGHLLDDVHLYDTRQQRWSGALHRRAGSNHAGEEIDLLGNHVLQPLAERAMGNVHALPAAQTGFEGDSPAKRAEHRAVAMDGLLYVFGGYGGGMDTFDNPEGKFGIMNDLYSFDPKALVWTFLDASSGNAPPRRAGHIMVSDPRPSADDVDSAGTGAGSGRFLYVFGGRGETKTGTDERRNVALSDVWRYSVEEHHWTLVSNDCDVSPPGRQHAAGGMLLDRIFVFGGVDPKSGYIFQDLWSFDTNAREWQELYTTGSQHSQWNVAPDTAVPGFAPPPLFAAHLLPVSGNSFLLYGGVGGGGVCGTEDCGQWLTTLGQTYRFTVGVVETATGSHRVKAVFDGATEDASYETETAAAPSLGDWTPDVGHSPELASVEIDPLLCSWNHSRLSGIGAARGRRRKLYALEEVAYAPHDGGYLFEFGGMQAMRDPTRTRQNAGGLYVPLSLDSGGALVYKAYDAESKEHLRTHVDLPTNARWHPDDAYTAQIPVPRPAEGTSDVQFVEGLKTHRVTLQDIVLIKGTDEVPNPSPK